MIEPNNAPNNAYVLCHTTALMASASRAGSSGLLQGVERALQTLPCTLKATFAPNPCPRTPTCVTRHPSRSSVGRLSMDARRLASASNGSASAAASAAWLKADVAPPCSRARAHRALEALGCWSVDGVGLAATQGRAGQHGRDVQSARWPRPARPFPGSLGPGRPPLHPKCDQHSHLPISGAAKAAGRAPRPLRPRAAATPSPAPRRQT